MKNIERLIEIQEKLKEYQEQEKALKEAVRLEMLANGMTEYNYNGYKLTMSTLVKSFLSSELKSKAIEYTQNLGIYEYFARFDISEAKIKEYVKENREAVETKGIASELTSFLEYKEDTPRIVVKKESE